jgi:hypothetical protein
MTQRTLLAVRWHSIHTLFAVVALTLFACGNNNLEGPTLNPSSSSNIAEDPSSSSINIIGIPATDFTFDDIQYWVGEGQNKAMLIIQWNDGKNPDALVWGYKWNGKKYGYDMVVDIAKTDERLFAITSNDEMFGWSIGGIGYDISGNNSIQLTFNGGAPQTPVNGLIENSDFNGAVCTDNKAHWATGWLEGYWGYWLWETDAVDNYPGSNKYHSSMLGASDRELTDGSRDIWYWDADLSTFGGDIDDLLSEFTPR